MTIYIVGGGVGSKSYLTAHGKSVIESSEVVITTNRLYEKLHSLNKNIICKSIDEIVPFIFKSEKINTLCVIVSGDVGFYSISEILAKKVGKEHTLQFINGISSKQYLASKIGIAYDDMKTISVHGRRNNVIPFVCYNKKVFVLTGGENKAHIIINSLIKCGLQDVIVTVGENLSYENEKIITDKAINLKGIIFDSLSVMLIENKDFVLHYDNLKDCDFVRDKVPMTKDTVRKLSVASLEIKPYDIVADIGAGSGAVTVEMARKAYEGYVFAMEKDELAFELIKQNIRKLKAYNVTLVKSFGPDGLDGFPIVDKVFIGGSGGNLKEIVYYFIRKNPDVKIVITAITLETLQSAIASFTENNFEYNLSCVNVSHSKIIGDYHLMKAENPIYIISGQNKAN